MQVSRSYMNTIVHVPVSVVLLLPVGISHSLNSLGHLESIDCVNDTKDKHIKAPC